MSKFWSSHDSNSDSDSHSLASVEQQEVSEAEEQEQNQEENQGEEEEDGYSTPPPNILPINDPDHAWYILRRKQTFSTVPTKTVQHPSYSRTTSISTSTSNHLKQHNPQTNHSNSISNRRQCLRIVCISDTHGKHHKLTHIPKCDILIHAGDFTTTGEASSVADLSNYFKQLLTSSTSTSKPIVRKDVLCIAGNHELTFDPDRYSKVWRRFHPKSGPHETTTIRNSLQNCVYLQDESYTYHHANPNQNQNQNQNSINTNQNQTHNRPIHFYGSPWTPTFCNWAFNLDRTIIHTKWDAIPTQTDVLITHGPPLGRGDLCRSQTRAGCLDLLRQIQNRIKPKIHVFGHIHEDYGVTTDGTTLFVNASSVDLSYRIVHPPIVLDLPLLDLDDDGDDGDMDVDMDSSSSSSSSSSFAPTSPAVVVKPSCEHFTPENVRSWFRDRGYHSLLPFLEKCQPPLEGKDLVTDFFDDYQILLSELKYVLFRDYNEGGKSVKELTEELLRAIMHLRAECYGDEW